MKETNFLFRSFKNDIRKRNRENSGFNLFDFLKHANIADQYIAFDLQCLYSLSRNSVSKCKPKLTITIHLKEDQWQTFKFYCLLFYLIVFRITNNLNFELLTWLKWKSALFFFGTPSTTLAWISYTFTLIKSWIKMKCDIGTWICSC